MSDKRENSIDKGSSNSAESEKDEKNRWSEGKLKGDFSRRRRRILLSIGGLSLFGIGGFYRFFSYPEFKSSEQFEILNSREREICRSLFEVVIPKGWYSESDLPRYVKNFDSFIRNLSREKRLLLRILLFSLEHSPLVNGFYLKRFSRLSPSQRLKVLESWRSSPLVLQRFGLTSLLSLLFISYYQTPREFERIGYSGPLLQPNSSLADPYIHLKVPEDFKLTSL